jgi:hypothetical protein
MLGQVGQSVKKSRILIPGKRTGVVLGLSAVLIIIYSAACSAAPDPGRFDVPPYPAVSGEKENGPGPHEVKDLANTSDGGERRPVLDMRRLKPPEGLPVHVEKIICDRPLDPGLFVTGVTGLHMPVETGFFLPPDGRSEGDQEVYVLLTDARGNTVIITSLLTLVRDTVPPVITGDIHKSICIGDTIAYRAGVTVTDNLDGHVALEVDSSAVDTANEGVYPVYYTATDSSGNTTTVRGSLTIHGVSLAHVGEMAAEVLGRITSPDMTPRETVRAIYDYVKTNVIYGSGRVRNNVPYAAYRGIRFGSGDCYTFYALAETLLNGAGIENIPVQRIAGMPTTHFWSLVNIGDGWHHFDTMPRNEYSTGFMLTQSQAEYHTRVSSVEGYYVYDRSLYPEVVP